MAKAKKNTTLTIDGHKKFAETWNKVCKDKDLDQIDRAIMQQIVNNPLATIRDMAKAINFSTNGILRRLKRQDFVAAERVFEGDFATRMERIALKVAKRMEKMLMVDMDLYLDKLKDIATSDMEPGQMAAAYRYLEKEFDPDKVMHIGKIALGFISKQAELGLTKEAIDKGSLPTLREARAILEADLEDETT